MTIVKAQVKGLSKLYSNGVEMQEIHVRLRYATGLPYAVGERTPISLRVGDRQFEAGLRALKSNGLAWICPDVRDDRGAKRKLADVLRMSGFQKGRQVHLEISGRSISVKPG